MCVNAYDTRIKSLLDRLAKAVDAIASKLPGK